MEREAVTVSAPGTGQQWGRPQGGPWWRFVPRSTAVGWLTLVSGVMLVVAAALSLLDHPSSGVTVLEVVIGVLGLAQIVRAIDGLRVLRARDTAPH